MASCEPNAELRFGPSQSSVRRLADWEIGVPRFLAINRPEKITTPARAKDTRPQWFDKAAIFLRARATLWASATPPIYK